MGILIKIATSLEGAFVILLKNVTDTANFKMLYFAQKNTLTKYRIVISDLKNPVTNF